MVFISGKVAKQTNFWNLIEIEIEIVFLYFIWYSCAGYIWNNNKNNM